MKNFGKELLKFRAKHDLTQKEISGILGVGVVMISRYETGVSEPTNKNRIAFMNKLTNWEAKKNV